MHATDEIGAVNPSQLAIVTVAATISAPETWTSCGGVRVKEHEGG